MNKNMSKKRLLALIKFFNEETDENHVAPMSEIIDYLSKQNIDAERRAIYDDISMLQEWGLDIIFTKTKNQGYFIANRDFDKTEIKIIIDAISSSSFVSKNKTKNLNNRLLHTLSKYQQASLSDQIIISKQKTTNEQFFYSIDTILSAIENNHSINFKYFDYTIKMEKSYRKNAQVYTCIPYNLVWINQRYYCIVYNEKHNKFLNFRVDKMEKVEANDDLIIKKPFNVEKYIDASFNMYHGDEEYIKVEFDSELSNIIIDQFGTNMIIEKMDKKNFVANIKTSISPTITGYLLQFGNKAKILGPSYYQKEVKQLINNLMKEYN